MKLFRQTGCAEGKFLEIGSVLARHPPLGQALLIYEVLSYKIF